MSTTILPANTTENFISRWKASGASERANYQLFLTELCELLGVEKPRPASDKVHEAAYTFERPVVFDDGEGKTSTNFIDLYKQHCFVLEAKQGSDKATASEAELLGAAKAKTKTGTATRGTRGWEQEMKKAKEQALRYARALPAAEGWPPFLVVVDVGYCIDLYADFARQGKTYVPFPDPAHYRIYLSDLERPELQERLRLLFTAPLELDPSKRAARVTRELAERLARLAASLEASGHTPEQVAGFLMRCLFSMFAEDVGLLPERSFSQLLQDYRQNRQFLPHALEALWATMDRGGFDPALHTMIPQFNGFLFKNTEALPLTEAQLDLLILASEASWEDVEPAIFGTLLERALQPRERHKLGAHFTPRAYVERLVLPTVIEPLREEWDAARAASAQLEANGDETGSLKEIEAFHRRLCSVRVLDPACGSGNFLYVTLEHLKRLEGEVTEYIAHFPRQLGLDMTGGYTVTPAQLLGLEVNPRAAAIADVVLWIGYLQWHFRTHGHARRLENPILRQYGNIQQQDAVLQYSERRPRRDANGQLITRWDGHTTKQHTITGLEVPDESARTSVYDYIDPKPANWPEAEFIVGNPPFIGASRMRKALGDGYTEALRKVYKGVVPASADYVMYWWSKAGKLLSEDKIEQFGFITTNSIKQTFNRRVIQALLQGSNPISIIYAIPDHPWVSSSDGAAVRIAMTVCSNKIAPGRLNSVLEEKETKGAEMAVLLEETIGKIQDDLTIGAAVSASQPLQANLGLSSEGVKPHGMGFVVKPEEAVTLGLNQIPDVDQYIRPYYNGKDITGKPRNVFIIDLFGLEADEIRYKFPLIYQWVLERVKPERDAKSDTKDGAAYAKFWWLFGKPRTELRKALHGLRRYIVTVKTAKHRFFQFIPVTTIADSKLIAFALEDSYHLGVLSSKIHVTWALAIGSNLGVGNDPTYVKSTSFENFPFPTPTEDQKQLIGTIAVRIDDHRKNRIGENPKLDITEMYNVMGKIRSGETLTSKEQEVNQLGLVSTLLQLHSELDAAVAAAYGWRTNLPEEEILERLVTLNKERAAEEARGQVRWLRPEYQNPLGVQQTGITITANEEQAETNGQELMEWPKSLAEQAQAVQRILQQYQHPISAADVSNGFKKASKVKAAREKQIEGLLETFNALGLLRKTEDGLFVK